MSVWDEYPADYRKSEIDFIIQTATAGDCVSVLGLSGSGKSNLLGYLANRGPISDPAIRFIFVDCNRLLEPSLGGFYRLVRNSILGGRSRVDLSESDYDEYSELEDTISNEFDQRIRICLLFDRFDIMMATNLFPTIANNLRSLRDMWKYSLTFVLSTRREVDEKSEVAELIHGHTIWLGPLSYSDALWSAERDAKRFNPTGKPWELPILEQLYELSWGYPSMLRACCEAFGAGGILSFDTMSTHPSVTRRIQEFWLDEPSEDMLEASRINGQPLLMVGKQISDYRIFAYNSTDLTAKEKLLLDYLIVNQGEVCDKDDLIQAIWPEDVIFERGVRDDSLAQLVRRLRKKVEGDPSAPQFIRTIPGRGYIFRRE